ncbi:ZP domain-containing protein-like [Oculina patagonica]
MKLILLVTFALVSQLVKGQNPPDPVGIVTCNDDHTVDISITNVDDLGEWETSEWQLEDSAACAPTFTDASTVTYDGLFLPDCSMSSEQLPDSIKYVLKVSATKGDPGSGTTGQLRAYDHLYYVSCDYDNQNRSSASFVPIVNRRDNDTGDAFFTFSLQAFLNDDLTGAVPNPIALNTTLYFKALVETQSANPNLDLFPVRCWSSKSADPWVADGDFDLIVDGCGNDTVSEDLYDTLFYNCTNDDIEETFSLRTYRYFGEPEDSVVYIHCDLRVCLANEPNSACECPTVDECDPANRKRRSLDDIVDESEVYRVRAGPYIFKNEEKEEEQVNEEEEGEADEQDKPQSFPTNVAIIVAVCAVVAVAIICATVFLVVRSRNKSRNPRNLHVDT